MTGVSPPLRFLGLVVGTWACARAALLAPQWWVEPTLVAGPSGPKAPALTPATSLPQILEPDVRAVLPLSPRERASASPLAAYFMAGGAAAYRRAAAVDSASSQAARHRNAPPPGPILPRASLAHHRLSRWSVSAWALLRGGESGPALAPAGTLGGSQAGARLLYRLNRGPMRPLSLSARLYAPLRQGRGAEAAAGIDWRPLARVPLNLLVERRQALAPEGRNAFALTVYGGHSARLPAGLRLDAYAQAGMVGLRRRDAFAEGSAQLSLPLGRLEIGAAAWGAAQPGADRLDAGPRLALRLPAADGELRLQADWRFRLAGEAAPGSGPAITLSTSF